MQVGQLAASSGLTFRELAQVEVQDAMGKWDLTVRLGVWFWGLLVPRTWRGR